MYMGSCATEREIEIEIEREREREREKDTCVCNKREYIESWSVFALVGQCVLRSCVRSTR